MALVLVVHMRAQEGKEDEAVGVMHELAEATTTGRPSDGTH